jgi:hypothetical protein
MTWRKREIMNEQERELDFMVAELEHENTLMRARNTRLEAEVTVLTEMVRVLSDRVAEMEAEQRPSTWVGLTEMEYHEIWCMDLNNKDIIDKTIAKLKEKNT